MRKYNLSKNYLNYTYFHLHFYCSILRIGKRATKFNTSFLHNPILKTKAKSHPQKKQKTKKC